MMKFKGFKFAMAAVLVSFAAMLTSCSSDDDNGTTPSSPGTPMTAIRQSVKVTYKTTPVDLTSIKALTTSDGVYMRYIDSDGSIKQQKLDFNDLNQSFTVNYNVGDSVYIGIEMIAAAKDTTEVRNLTGTIAPTITITAEVVSSYDSGTTTTDTIKRRVSLEDITTTYLGMIVEYGGFSSTYDMSNSRNVSQLNRLIATQATQYGGVVYNCLSAKVGPKLTGSYGYSSSSSTYWRKNTFTAQ